MLFIFSIILAVYFILTVVNLKVLWKIRKERQYIDSVLNFEYKVFKYAYHRGYKYAGFILNVQLELPEEDLLHDWKHYKSTYFN